MNKPTNDFSQGSVKRWVLSQALPLTLAQLVHLLYNIVDRIYIGHLPEGGSMALTGLGITFPVIILIGAFTNLYGQGGAPLFSITRGQRNEAEAERILGNTFALLAGTSLILMALCYWLKEPLLFLQHKDTYGGESVRLHTRKRRLLNYSLKTSFLPLLLVKL